jgi:hypothetical protein
MRAILALAMVVGLAGCTDSDWAQVATYVRAQGTFGGDAAVGPSAPVAPPNARCQEVASNRSADVAEQGFDGDTSKAVYGRAYADCVAWAARGSNVVAK